MTSDTQSAYKDAGVDIDAAASLVDRIKPHIATTKRSGVMSGLGGFGALFDLKATGYQDPILVSGTDGVGTKLKVAIEAGLHSTIGIDAVAMCVNDIIVQGAEPLFFLDYFATGKLDNNVAEAVIASIAKGCAESGCALIGGETAEMPGMYAAGDYDIAGFSVGAVERDQMITGAAIEDGDVILGLASSGIHSNGFSLVRHIVKGAQGYSYDQPAAFTQGRNLGEFLLTPTRLYVKSLLQAFAIKDDGKQAIHGLVHVTGGGFYENVPRILPEGLNARIDVSAWDLPAVFKWLAEAGQLSHRDLASTFNCGIGMIVICKPEYADAIADSLTGSGETVYRIGAVERGEGASHCVLDNMDQAWPTRA